MERQVSGVRKIFIAVMVLAAAASIGYAAEGEHPTEHPTATEPISATVESVGTFVGKVVNVVTEGAADTAEGTSKASVTVANETGKTMMFPIDATVKITDAAMNTVPLKQVKEGSKVFVEYVTGKDGKEKAKSVTVKE